jgi:hypothetical protein
MNRQFTSAEKMALNLWATRGGCCWGALALRGGRGRHVRTRPRTPRRASGKTLGPAPTVEWTAFPTRVLVASCPACGPHEFFSLGQTRPQSNAPSTYVSEGRACWRDSVRPPRRGGSCAPGHRAASLQRTCVPGFLSHGKINPTRRQWW